MDVLLEKFCDILAGELERQENVLALCRAQRDAIATRDIPGLEARTAAMQTLTRESIQSEFERRRALHELALALERPVDPATLSELIALVPEKWHPRLRFYQDRLDAVMRQTRSLVRENSLLLRRCLRWVGHGMRAFEQAVNVHAPQYTARGCETRDACVSAAALVNQVG